MSIFDRRNKNLSLLVDIGSSSIGVGILLAGVPPKLIASKRVAIPFQGSLDYKRLVSLMLKSVEGSITELLQKTNARPIKITCFFASPWYTAEVRVASLIKDKLFKFTKEVFNKIVNDEVSWVEKEKYGNLKNKVRFIEKAVQAVKLNGYSSTAPFEKEVTEAQIHLLLALAPERIVSLVKERIEKVAPYAEITFHSFILPYFSVMRAIAPNAEDCLLMDIGGEVTDVAISRKGVLSGIFSFPMGRNFLFRQASKALKKSPEETHSFIRLLAEGKLEKKIAGELGASLLPVREEWLAELHKGLQGLAGELSLPEKVFIAADGDVVKWFIDAVEKEEYGQYALSSSKFDITPVGISLLGKHLQFTDGTMERDPFLAVEALFATLPQRDFN